MQPIVKSITITLLLLVLATGAWGVGSQTINYQGYLRNTAGTPLNSLVTVTFSLYATASGGSAIWTESQSVTPANGVYSVQLGSVTAFPAGLFTNDNLYLGVRVGNDNEMTPRQQLSTAPYAFRAGSVDSLTAAQISGILQSGYLAANLSTPLNAAPASSDNYRILLDQAITVTSVSVTSGGTVTDTKCAPPLLTLTDGTAGRDIVLPYFSSELNADSESLLFSQGSVLRLGAAQGLFCPSSSSQSPPSYKVVVRFRPTTAGDVSQCSPGTTSCNGYCADTSTSAQNCGLCGNVCSTPTNGIAVCRSGECDVLCAAGATMCDGNCVFIKSDPNNCGNCGTHCGPQQTCSGGGCITCPGGGYPCNNTCCATTQVCGTEFITVGKFRIPKAPACLGSCPTGTTACNGKCVDTSSDTNNCGACNTLCNTSAGQICAAGQCVCPDGSKQPSCEYIPYQYSPPFYQCATPTNPNACGACGNTCSSTQTCVGGTCVTCASGIVCNQNGGIFGSRTCCGVGQVCQAGECRDASQACPLGQTYCSNFGGCTDTSTDKRNCGVCGKRCDSYMGNPATMVCSAGQCQLCPNSKPLSCGTSYGYACVAMDNSNCAFCGNTCPTGTTCLTGEYPPGLPVGSCCPTGSTLVNGNCQCPTGLTLCGNACVNAQTDSNNCGTCGLSCSGAEGMFCWGGRCTSCSGGQTYCNGACVKTQTDPDNCGTCSNQCGSGQSCFAGVCATPASCANGQTACNNVCYSLQTDVNNCGTCGNVCATGQYCSAGQCTSCSKTICDNTCVSTQTSTSNCGSCGHACGSGQVCASGNCQTPVSCTGGQTACSNTCVDMKTDNNNCGYCGHKCASGAACAAGSCITCSSSQTICSGACANLKTDSSNCGSCGNICNNGKICVNGTCQCPSGTASCNGVCTWLQTSANCGSCGNACTSDKPNCISGMCNPACTFPQQACKGSCVDTSSDTGNCGGCGNVCPQQYTCYQSMCVSSMP